MSSDPFNKVMGGSVRGSGRKDPTGDDALYREVHGSGTISWHLYKGGPRHREDGPALELENGTRSWYRHGKLHREDGPAVELPSRRREWWLNGELHREDGPPCDISMSLACVI